MSNLKPCPFCTGKAIEVDDALSVRFDYPKAVKCYNCGASHMNADQWNRRPAKLPDGTPINKTC